VDDRSEASGWIATLVEALAPSENVDDLTARFVRYACEVITAPAGGMYVFKPQTSAVQHAATFGVSDFFLSRYEDVGRDVDPVLHRVLQEKVAVDNLELTSDEEWRHSVLYREVLQLHSFTYIMQTPVVYDDEIYGVIVLAGTSGWNGIAELRRVATTIGRVVGVSLLSLRKRQAAERERDQLVRALDMVSEAVVVTDAKTGKRHHNRRAQRLLDELRANGIEHFDDLIAGQTSLDKVLTVTVPVPSSTAGDLELSVQSIVAEDDAATTISFLRMRNHGVHEVPEIPEIYSRLLSRREQDVVALVVDGLHDHDIARRLNISQHTAKQYLKSTYRKLGVGSRVELVRLILLRAVEDARG
jgi:DNA-binding CsgD family transcriptional regulator